MVSEKTAKADLTRQGGQSIIWRRKKQEIMVWKYSPTNLNTKTWAAWTGFFVSGLPRERLFPWRFSAGRETTGDYSHLLNRNSRFHTQIKTVHSSIRSEWWNWPMRLFLWLIFSSTAVKKWSASRSSAKFRPTWQSWGGTAGVKTRLELHTAVQKTINFS